MTLTFLEKRLLIALGLLVLFLLILLAGEFWFLNLRKPPVLPTPHAVTIPPTQFGAALERAGIETQSAPSQRH
jgi:hypothetical protein